MTVPPSRLVLGCMGLGGGWDERPIEAAHVDAAEAAVEAALAAGITLFDHADIYTRGKAEAVFGQVLARRPDLRGQVRLQTKCGITLARPGAVGRYDNSAAAIVDRVEGSLRRLGVERVDTLLVHRPDPLARPEEVAEAFDRLHRAGKVGRLGVSNMSAAQMAHLQRALDAPLAVNQLEMSLARPGFVEAAALVNHPDGAGVDFPHGTLEYCAQHGVEVQAWGALAQGRFSGAATTPDNAPDSATTAVVAGVAARIGATAEAVVLGWLLKHPAGIRPVVGTTNPKRIAACAQAGAAAAAMTGDDWYALWVAARGRPLP